MDAVKIQNLSKTYKGGVVALKNINFSIESGDFFALLGSNGAGKTTIIGILTSLVTKSGGKVEIFGKDIEKDHDEVKKMIGVVPQEFNFSIFEKVADIVVNQSGYFGIPRKEAVKRTEEVLKDLELWDKRNSVSMTLSGGMKRRLMIARALIHKPKLLILDEPTAGVDVELRRGMWEYLRKLNANGTTILLTTHYLEEVEQLCKNVAMIKNGEIVKQDSVQKLLDNLEQQSYILNVSKSPEESKCKEFKFRKVDEFTIELDLKAEQRLSDFIFEMRQHDIHVIDVRPKANRMEQLFLNLLEN